MATLKEKQQELDAKRKALVRIFSEAGPDRDFERVTSLEGTVEEKIEQVRRLTEELDSLHDEVKKLEQIDQAAKRFEEPERLDMPEGGQRPQLKSLGDAVVESKVYQEHRYRPWPEAVLIDVGIKEMKTLFQTSAGWAPESTRIPRVELTPERALRVNDLPAAGTTSQNTIKYMEETTKTNNAAETAEGAAFPESALALTERTSPVQKIATFIPVTDEQLEDVDQARDYINTRLVRFLQERLDSQLLVGDGVSPNLTGILNVTGIQTQAKGTDATPTAIYKAITKVRFTGFAEPDAVVLHPNDWQDIATLQTADGIYIWANPGASGAPERIWGLPVVVTPAITENTGLVGSFRGFSQVWMRRGIEIKVSDSHSTYFTEGKLAVRADMRVAFVVYRPSAFCTVTGI